MENYLILDYSEIDKVNFNEIGETSIETVRLTNDGLKTFIKWNGEQPVFVNDLISKSQVYTHSEMLGILDLPEWSTVISGTTF